MPEFIKPLAFVLLRIGLAGILLLIFQISFIGEKVKGIKDYGLLALCAFFGVAANMSFFFKGLSLTSPINASLIMTSTPIVVFVLSLILLNEKIRWLRIAGILIGATGAILLIITTNNSSKLEGINLAGDLMVLFNASSYAAYLVLVKPQMKKYHPFTVIRWTFTFGFFMVLPFSWNELMSTDWNAFANTTWLSLVYVVLGTTFLTYLLNAYSLRYASSSLVGAYIYLQPVFATIIAVLSGYYELSISQILFGILIMLGVYLVSSTGKKAKA